jgi:hypothetical protein
LNSPMSGTLTSMLLLMLGFFCSSGGAVLAAMPAQLDECLCGRPGRRAILLGPLFRLTGCAASLAYTSPPRTTHNVDYVKQGLVGAEPSGWVDNVFRGALTPRRNARTKQAGAERRP